MPTAEITAAALVVGAALAVSGAVLQSVLRNPLAEPYLLGTVGGAAFFSVLAMNLGLTALGAWVLPTASFLGSTLALGTVVAVAVLARRMRSRTGGDAWLRSSGSTVVLAGFVTGGFFGSLDMLVLAYARAEDVAAVNRWLFGSLAAVTPTALALTAAVSAGAFAALMALVRPLQVIEIGRDEAECLGVNASLVIFAALALVSLMTAVSVALAGAIGFVGLVVPHFVRRWCGPRLKLVLPLSAVLGGTVLYLAEIVTERLPGSVGVGVVAAILAAPFFLWLLISRRGGEGRDI